MRAGVNFPLGNNEDYSLEEVRVEGKIYHSDFSKLGTFNPAHILAQAFASREEHMSLLMILAFSRSKKDARIRLKSFPEISICGQTVFLVFL